MEAGVKKGAQGTVEEDGGEPKGGVTMSDTLRKFISDEDCFRPPSCCMMEALKKGEGEVQKEGGDERDKTSFRRFAFLTLFI